MNSGKKRSVLPYIPGYDNNTLLKLIFFIAGAYILLALTWAVSMIVNITPDSFNTYIIPNLSLPRVNEIGSKWWTIFVYGILHVPNSFMNMLSNMLWLYCFGSVVQMLIGKKQIVPLFFYGLLVGGLFYLAAQFLPGSFADCPPYVMGPRAGIMAMCVAAITLSPRYRFYLSETFSIPMAVVAGIFIVLMILGTGYWMPVAAMLGGGALVGFGYIKLLKTGYKPGEWMYSFGNSLEAMVTPKDTGKAAQRTGSTKGKLMQLPTNEDKARRVDEILDKINRKGYKSLSDEEKNILNKAAKE